MSYLRRLSLLFALLLASLLPEAHAQARNQGVIIREGTAFRVVCHFEDELAAERALEIADATWAPAARAYGAPIRTPEDRIRVHLYDDRDEFDKACIALEGRTWPAHAGLTSARYGIAVLLMGDGVNPRLQRQLGPHDSDLYTIAHECTHLVGARLAPGYAEHPSWLTEGLAEEVARQVLGARAAPLPPPPTNQTRAAAAAAAYAESGDRGLRQLLSGQVPGRDSFEHYAIQGAFVRFLRDGKHSAAFTSALTKPTGDGLDWSASLAAACEVPQLAALESSFASFLRELTPHWGLGPGHFESEGRGRWRQVALDTGRSWAWQLNPTPAARISLRAWISPNRNGSEAAIWIAALRQAERSTDGEWSERILAFQLLPGAPVRFCQLTKGSGREPSVQVLAEAPQGSPQLSPATGLDLTLDWIEDDLVLQLAGEEALRLDLSHETRGAARAGWGFGVDAGGLVRWRLH